MAMMMMIEAHMGWLCVLPPRPAATRPMPPAAAHPSAQKSEHELLLRSKRLFEDKLQALQVRPIHQ